MDSSGPPRGPPVTPARRVLLIYAYHESPMACKNLEFFCRHGMDQTADVDYYLCINGDLCTALSESRTWNPARETVAPPPPPVDKYPGSTYWHNTHVDVAAMLGTLDLAAGWKAIFKRENTGYDFAAWKHAMDKVGTAGYTHFVFINDTVRGPFEGEHEGTWIDRMLGLLDDTVKLAGLSINCWRQGCGATRPHVQSMLFCTDRAGMKIIEPIMGARIVNKWMVILKQEVGMSEAVLDAGYNISCLLEPYQLDYRGTYVDGQRIVSRKTMPRLNCEGRYCGDIWYANTYFGRTLKAREAVFVKVRPMFGVDCERETEEAERSLAHRIWRKVMAGDPGLILDDLVEGLGAALRGAYPACA